MGKSQIKSCMPNSEFEHIRFDSIKIRCSGKRLRIKSCIHNKAINITIIHILCNRLSTHCCQTHLYFLHNDPQPLCVPCHSPFSIEHILRECIDFQPIRVNYYSTSDISRLFHKVRPSSILQYMKDICLYNKL